MSSSSFALCSPSLLRRLWDALVGARPESLFSLARRPRPSHRSTENLWVLEVGFEIRSGTDAEKALAERKEYLLKTYGIDLLVMEPGFRLRRWDSQ